MPRDVCSELTKQQHRERRGADAVGVVVAVHADPGARIDRGHDRLAPLRACRRAANGSWPGNAPVEEPPGRGSVAEPAPHEHGSSHLVDRELLRERAHLTEGAGGQIPGCGCHRPRRGYGARRTEKKRLFARQTDPEQRQHDHDAERGATKPPRIQLGWPDSRTVAANARPSRISTPRRGRRRSRVRAARSRGAPREKTRPGGPLRWDRA